MEVMIDTAKTLQTIRETRGWTPKQLAEALGSSLASIARWESGSAHPSPQQRAVIDGLAHGASLKKSQVFASTGARRGRRRNPSLFAADDLATTKDPGPPILERISDGRWFSTMHSADIELLLEEHATPARTALRPPSSGMSAGKNTYTYDAHTYHTKVPPQGIAELLEHYLPEGGLVLDPFAGSGMTGVAASATGYDCVLNELSPAACFIASQFLSSLSPDVFDKGLSQLMAGLAGLRHDLYTTTCRECTKRTELLYTVWSYRVLCPHCGHDFNLWDVCRSYGRTVREHKILSSFDCPRCKEQLKKGELERLDAEPVCVGYKCCSAGRQEMTHPPCDEDLDLINAIEANPPVAPGFFPIDEIPDGVNLGQPRRHGLTSIEKLYTRRNLAGLSHLWRDLHRFEDDAVCAALAFVFTSLYRRVTRLSEFRFWGGSGNTARLNVPFIFDEPNVFISFERKARTILDHLATTATHFRGRVAISSGSATRLDFLPDSCVDLVFTDPPFGANINYSEMNLLWEAWLGQRTNSVDEAVINRVQGKNVEQYQDLMRRSLSECHRVLRPGNWLLLVFMNSSAVVWRALREAITDVGFVIVKADVFDKQHGTFKHFVSENTAGADLVLHCLKPAGRTVGDHPRDSVELSEFLSSLNLESYHQAYLHVARDPEVDLRRVYSEWIAQTLIDGTETIDFAEFRERASEWAATNGGEAVRALLHRDGTADG